MGIFSQWQPRYAQHGIATYPVGDAKIPMVRQYQRIGLHASSELALKFGEASNFAFLAGGRSRISAVDVDTSDERVWHEAERLFGSTPLWIRTGSGHVQMLYRHHGEGRHIRPHKDLPVDILGTGTIVTAPSVRGQGYQLIRGTLADLDDLPQILGLEAFRAAGKVANSSGLPGSIIPVGSRNSSLLAHLRSEARHCDILEDLIDVGVTFADGHFEHGSDPFPHAEIERVAKSVWSWTKEKMASGEYFVGTGRSLQISFDVQDRLMQSGADAWYLYGHLRRCRYRDATFSVPNDMRFDLPGGAWSVVRFRTARSALLACGVLVQRQAASSYHGPAAYAWGHT